MAKMDTVNRDYSFLLRNHRPEIDLSGFRFEIKRSLFVCLFVFTQCIFKLQILLLPNVMAIKL